MRVSSEWASTTCSSVTKGEQPPERKPEKDGTVSIRRRVRRSRRVVITGCGCGGGGGGASAGDDDNDDTKAADETADETAACAACACSSLS